MSQNLFVFLIDVEALKACYGSHDATLLHEVQQASGDAIAADDRWFANGSQREAFSLNDALGEIIAGKVEHSQSGAQYGYALQLLCEQLGERLPTECFRDFRGDWLQQVGLVLPLVESGPPIPIPAAADFPSIGFLTRDQIAKQLAELEKVEFSHPIQEVVLARHEFLDWLEEADKAKKDLVGFYV